MERGERRSTRRASKTSGLQQRPKTMFSHTSSHSFVEKQAKTVLTSLTWRAETKRRTSSSNTFVTKPRCRCLSDNLLQQLVNITVCKHWIWLTADFCSVTGWLSMCSQESVWQSLEGLNRWRLRCEQTVASLCRDLLTGGMWIPAAGGRNRFYNVARDSLHGSWSCYSVGRRTLCSSCFVAF